MVADAVWTACYKRVVYAAVVVVFAVKAQRQSKSVSVAYDWRLCYPFQSVSCHWRSVYILSVCGVRMTGGIGQSNGIAVGG